MEKNKNERMDSKSLEPLKVDILWGIALFFVAGHLSAVYGLYLVFASAKICTTLFGKFLSTSFNLAVFFQFYFKKQIILFVCSK